MASLSDPLPRRTGWRGEVGRTSRLALPMVAAYLAELGMWWTDQAIVGRLGAEELAAVGLSGGVLFQGLAISMGLLSIVAVLVGNAFGASRPDAFARAVRQGMKAATVLTVIVMVFAWFVPDLLVLADQDPVIVELAGEYVRAVMFSVAPFLYFTVLRGFMAGISRPMVVTAITVAAIPLNLGLNVLLVFGAEIPLGQGSITLPAMGVAGAAWGSVAITWLMFAVLVADILLRPATRHYRVLARPMVHDQAEWRAIWKLGLPVGVLTLIEGGLFTAVSLLAGLIGIATLAANQVTGSLVGFTAMISVGIGEAAAVRVAQEIGAGRPGDARLVGFVALVLGVLVALVFAAPLLFAPELLAALFLDIDDPANAETLRVVALMCAIAALFLIFDCLQIIGARALRGLHDTVAPAWISFFGYWVLAVPLAVLLAFPLDLGGAGLWLGMAAGLALAAVWLCLRFARLSRVPGAGS
jgi:MATE family multidrug resistance protein